MFQINVFVRFDMRHVIVLALIIFGYVSTCTSEPSPEIIPIPGGKQGTGVTTRFWDCCKPSCSWRGNLRNTSATPVTSCGIDGDTAVDPDLMSACDLQNKGPAYMCTNQQPFVVNSTLAYGYVAASFTGSTDYQLCCGCVLLSFQGQLAGKHLLAQVTDAGSDLVVNQFDIAIPGGGVGIGNGCTEQWNAPPDGWGARYGGISTEEECDELPIQLQPGCHFRFQFMEGVPNPDVTFIQVECPRELVDTTGCELRV
ncbi:endoglucanase isoform X1 [Leptinotarsa decemlineata]